MKKDYYMDLQSCMTQNTCQKVKGLKKKKGEEKACLCQARKSQGDFRFAYWSDTASAIDPKDPMRQALY